MSEKKPTGSTSPPAGSPAPPAAASASTATMRSAYLPYAPAFSVLLQCLKMVRMHKIIIPTENWHAWTAMSQNFVGFFLWKEYTLQIYVSLVGDRLEGAEAGS